MDTSLFDKPGARTRAAPRIDDVELRTRIDGILNRRPSVGLAVGVIRNGSLDFFCGHGLADIASRTPVTEDTVFRMASLTKTVTAIAVMQLWEQGLVDLDCPANDYLRAYELTPDRPAFRPATLRHLLTHTAGIPEVLRVRDLLHPEWGPFESRPGTLSVGPGEPLPRLSEYYRGGLRMVADPGTAFAYTNHGFATLGQIVEDVSGMPVERYLREHILRPLGMADSDLVRSERIRSRLATGYALGRGGAKAVPDREWIGVGCTSLLSTTRDMARYAAALLQGGANEHSSILKPATLASMFEPHYQPDPRVPGMGLAFFRGDAGGHLVISHEGILPGFNSGLFVAPEDGVGVLGFTNGSKGAMGWLAVELGGLLRYLLDVPDDVVRTDVSHRPELWSEYCGRYQVPSRISDLRERMMLGGGVEVFVRRGQLMLRVLTPVPVLARGFPLHPDDEKDPDVFRLDLSRFGMPTARVVFRRGDGVDTTAMHTDLGSHPVSLYKRHTAGSRFKKR